MVKIPLVSAISPVPDLKKLLPEPRCPGLAVARVCCPVLRDLFLIPISDREQHLLGIDEVATLLAVIFQNAGLDNRVDGAGFLAESAEYALRKVDIISRGTARAVLALLGFNRNGKRGTNRLAQLACDAALFSIRVTAQRVQPAEAGRQGRLFLGKVNGNFARKHIPAGE